jgi:hypothetical protein
VAINCDVAGVSSLGLVSPLLPAASAVITSANYQVVQGFHHHQRLALHKLCDGRKYSGVLARRGFIQPDRDFSVWLNGRFNTNVICDFRQPRRPHAKIQTRPAPAPRCCRRSALYAAAIMTHRQWHDMGTAGGCCLIKQPDEEQGGR